MIQNLEQILLNIQQSFNKHSLIAIHLSHYKGTEPSLKRIHIRKTLVKNEYVLSFTYQYATKDIVKNFTLADSIQLIEGLVKVEGFRLIRLLTLDFDKKSWSVRKIITFASTQREYNSLKPNKLIISI